MGEIEGQPGSTFPIGAGSTKNFSTGGELVVFANDSSQNYANKKGSIQLRGRLGSETPVTYRTTLDLFLDVFGRIQGIPMIAAIVLGVSYVLVFTRQGQDLVGGVGEDDFFNGGNLQIAFVLGLMFLALQAWSWAQLIIASSYGPNRTLWRPRVFLVWTPRVLGFMPFAAAAAALSTNPNSNTWFVLALIALGVVFITFVVRSVDISTRLARRGAPGLSRSFQPAWVIVSLITAVVVMLVATLAPVSVGVTLGAPAVVFVGLGFIIPVMVVAIQTGSALRIPVVGVLLVAAVIFGSWNDNHAVGRRFFGIETTGPIKRLSLNRAYELWRSAQPGGLNAKKTMILVAAEGGASRAGYWTALALATLRGAARAAGVDFDKHLFAISSVSGGSVGSVGYAAMLRSEPDTPDFKLRLLNFAGQNALGSAMTGMLFPDLLQRFLPAALLPDRAEAQERSWENAWASSGASRASASLMSEPFLNLAPREGELWRPILIIQGTSENTGRRVLTSGVRFDCNEVDADDFLESRGQDVAASTAILNGARFSWYSPAGTFPASYCGNPLGVTDHIVDGGYFDNSGAETLREMARALHAIRAKAGETDPLEFVFVLIGYRDADSSKPTPALAINDVFAPLFTGLGASPSAHEAHLARGLKLVGQSEVEEANPYTSRMTGGDFDYAALVLCKGQIESGGSLRAYEPPNWSLSGTAKRYFENALLAGTGACNANENAATIEAIVDRLRQ